jgi:Icc-related predicted phosphoesterase
LAGRRNLSKANSHNTKKQASKSRATSTSSAFSPQGEHFFGEPKYVLGEIDFKNPNRDEWRYREAGFKEMSRIVQSVPDPKVTPPRMNLEDIIRKESIQKIQKADRIVFHSVGDTGAKYTRAGLQSEALVTDKMAADFNESNPADIPSFLYHLGDVIYNFGEDEYYYDQFYEPFRNYQAPVFAIPGNHDGITYMQDPSTSLAAFLKHFCDDEPHHAPEAGGLARTTMTQPGVYFTLTAPLVTIIGLYSNVLEDPGVISSEGGKYPKLDDKQKDFLKSELKRLDNEKYSGAVILAVHHPPYTSGVLHAGSSGMLKDIEDAIQYAGNFAPHAVLSGHAHNYQRYTRVMGRREIPFIVAGSGGHNALPIRPDKGNTVIRAPMTIGDVSFRRYFADYGYLRIVVTTKLMSIEFHNVSSGLDSKSPADICTVDLRTRTLTTTRP